MTPVAGREVLDRTGLKGIYDIDVKYAPTPGTLFAELPLPDRATRPDLFTAVREQLGFELEPSTIELPVHWIQQAERPSLD